jgi:hypothetical protein
MRVDIQRGSKSDYDLKHRGSYKERNRMLAVVLVLLGSASIGNARSQTAASAYDFLAGTKRREAEFMQ